MSPEHATVNVEALSAVWSTAAGVENEPKLIVATEETAHPEVSVALTMRTLSLRPTAAAVPHIPKEASAAATSEKFCFVNMN
jgi:hypothetical protein